ncbi:hypothetical protein LCGC14_2704020 [marine sediment metagenome]|uniref:Uncharacterized protein n=1 Tax=marine sediment metagenome TaxID=412755 RepID=A0A0F8ZEY0_9ZZZZ
MAAHLRDINLKCYSGYCPKEAKVTLHNWRNQEISQYCRRHGNEELKRAQAEEKAEFEAANT